MKKFILPFIIIFLLLGCSSNNIDEKAKLPYRKLIKEFKSNIPQSFKTDNPITHFDRGNAYLKGLYKIPDKKRKSYIANIINEFNTTIKLDPHFAPAYYSLGIAYLKANEPNKALKPFRKAVLLNPEFKEYKLAYAYVCAANNKKNRAIKIYKSLLNSDPDNIDILIPLGDLYFSKKSYHKAYKTFKTVLEKDPENILAQKALKKLKTLKTTEKKHRKKCKRKKNLNSKINKTSRKEKTDNKGS